VSEVPLGSFLSGGIDSSAIVALMSKVCPGNVKTFTVGFGDGQPGADERPYARTIAEMFKTDHSECLYDNPQTQVELILPSMIQAFDEPFADSSMIPNYLVCQAARQWVTVALSGIGGDEVIDRSLGDHGQAVALAQLRQQFIGHQRSAEAGSDNDNFRHGRLRWLHSPVDGCAGFLRSVGRVA